MFPALLPMVYIFCSLFVLREYVLMLDHVSDFNNRNQFLSAKVNKVIDIIKFVKNFLNSTTNTQS